MKIPPAIKEKMYLVVAVGALCQLSAEAKPQQQSTSTTSSASTTSPSTNKNGGAATTTTTNAMTNNKTSPPPPSINADERRRALRERFEKLRKNPNLRRQTVNDAVKKSNSVESKTLQTSEAIKARECVECGRG